MASTRDKYLALAIKCMERELLFTSAPGCKPGFQLCEERLVTNTENMLSNIYERHAIAWWQTRKIIKHPFGCKGLPGRFVLLATRLFFLLKSVEFLSQGTIWQNNSIKEKGLGESGSSFFFPKFF